MPPLRFLGPSFGIGRALVTLEGGGAANLSICFSILSRRLSPYEPNQNDVKGKGAMYPTKGKTDHPVVTSRDPFEQQEQTLHL